MNSKHLLKVHEDIITVPTTLKELYEDYKKLDYEVDLPMFNMFFYHLQDGTIIRVFWEDGCFWEDIHSYSSNYQEREGNNEL